MGRQRQAQRYGKLSSVGQHIRRDSARRVGEGWPLSLLDNGALAIYVELTYRAACIDSRSNKEW